MTGTLPCLGQKGTQQRANTLPCAGKGKAWHSATLLPCVHQENTRQIIHTRGSGLLCMTKMNTAYLNCCRVFYLLHGKYTSAVKPPKTSSYFSLPCMQILHTANTFAVQSSKIHTANIFAVPIYTVYVLPCVETRQSLRRVPECICRVLVIHGKVLFSLSVLAQYVHIYGLGVFFPFSSLSISHLIFRKVNIC
jgi:hypothetical protein